MLLNCEHAFQSDQRPAGDIFLDVDLVDDRTLDDIFEAPAQVSQIDSVHGSAHADQGGEEMDFLFWMLFFEAVDQVEFGPDSPFGTGGSFLDRLDDLAGRARDVGDVVDLLGALGMDQDLDPGNLFAELLYVDGLEHLVD